MPGMQLVCIAVALAQLHSLVQWGSACQLSHADDFADESVCLLQQSEDRGVPSMYASFWWSHQVVMGLEVTQVPNLVREGCCYG